MKWLVKSYVHIVVEHSLILSGITVTVHSCTLMTEELPQQPSL